jgi:UDP-N-acetylmuramoyl-tripeptide--D-alanyl-D-alanine ligase
MEPMTIRELVEAVHGRPLGEWDNWEDSITQVEIDSRTISEGALFIPLIGEHFDGHAYINAALEQGAAGCLTARERESYLPGKFYIKVDSTQNALRDLARYYKRKFHIPFVGITGSVGKTTTKDMVAAVLSQKYNVLKTEGNYNNEVGLPLTLLRLDRTHQIGVLEMGMNHFGEISYLTHIVEPEVAIITNIGDAHIENLGSRENILKAKCEIFETMPEDTLTILNGDDELLTSLRNKLAMKTVFCGKAEGCDYRADRLQSDGNSHIFCQAKTPHMCCKMEIPSLGEHMIYPALMATAVGEHFGLSQQEILDGIMQFAPTKMRMNILRRADGITILDDTYNANPQSMRAAVGVLADMKGNYKVAILGDMFELGSLSAALHTGVGEYAGKAGIQCLLAVGDWAEHIYQAAKENGVPETYYCKTKEEAMPVLRQVVHPNATILCKASRGMGFEDLVDELKRLTKSEEA